MRLLHVSSGNDFGGGERHVFELVTALVARGHTVHVAVRPQSQLWEKLALVPSMTLHPLGLRNALDLISVVQLCRILVREHIDVIHAHYGRDYPLVAAAVRWVRASRSARPAFFFTRHHYLPLSSHALYRSWLSVANGALAVSSSVRDTVCQSLGWTADRVRVIPNWIEVEKFSISVSSEAARQTFHLPVPAKLIGVINQLHPAKGQKEAVEAFSMLATEFPELHLVFAGQENEGTRFTQTLHQAIAKADLTERVHFLGFVEQVPLLLKALDLVAIPSWNEAFSIGALEALAAGVPIVASQVGGLGEILTQNETALLVTPQQVKPLADAFRCLLLDEALYHHLQETGRHLVKNRYTRDSIVDQVEQMYTAALSLG